MDKKSQLKVSWQEIIFDNIKDNILPVAVIVIAAVLLKIPLKLLLIGFAIFAIYNFIKAKFKH